MFNNYKVYYNNSWVCLRTNGPQMNENFTKVVEGQPAVDDFLANSGFMFRPGVNDTVLLVCPTPGEAMCRFMEGLDVIVAGGGIVNNEHQHLLMIYRRGMWDLPKGKIELTEKVIEGAIREVEEETGVKITEAHTPPITTYHAYFLKGKKCLKQTEWFTMRAAPGQTHLTPQTEEDIEEVRWVPAHHISNYRHISYPLVWHLIEPYARPE